VYTAWLREARRFGQKFWDIVGSRTAPKIVLEHTGEDAIPTSMYLCGNAGMVVICGGTTGYHAGVDLRFLWMRQKRLQGPHFANLRHCREVISLVDSGHLDPCLTWCESFENVGAVHQLMYENQHPGGNMTVLVNATEPGSTELS
jgi:crotonyl-CoA carboxylase/reductase